MASFNNTAAELISLFYHETFLAISRSVDDFEWVRHVKNEPTIAMNAFDEFFFCIKLTQITKFGHWLLLKIEGIVEEISRRSQLLHTSYKKSIVQKSNW